MPMPGQVMDHSVQQLGFLYSCTLSDWQRTCRTTLHLWSSRLAGRTRVTGLRCTTQKPNPAQPQTYQAASFTHLFNQTSLPKACIPQKCINLS